MRKPQSIAVTVCLLLQILPACVAEVVKSRADLIGIQIPLSFTYGGRSSEEFIKNWKKAERTTPNGSLRTTSYTDPQTGLE